MLVIIDACHQNFTDIQIAGLSQGTQAYDMSNRLQNIRVRQSFVAKTGNEQTNNNKQP